jgi:hypothetical protein
MSLDKSITINDIAAPMRMHTWELNPGFLYILGQAHEAGLKQPIVNAIFKKFIEEKIPVAQKIIRRLSFKHAFKDFHLTLPLKTVFFIHIDELIEHYQNQLDQRDVKIDEEYIKLKQMLSKNLAEIWPEDNHEIDDFLNLLKSKLCLVEAVPPDFDETIAQWSHLLKIQYLANMTIPATYLRKDYSTSHRILLGSNYGTLSDSYKFRFYDISYGKSVQAYFLSLQQLSKDFSWILPKMVEKLPPLNNEKLEEEFFQITHYNNEESGNQKRDKQSVSSLVEEYANEMKDLISQLYLLNTQQNEKLESLLFRIIQAQLIVCHGSKDLEKIIKKLKQNKDQVYAIAGIDLHADHYLLPHLLNYSECVQLKSNYLDITSFSLIVIMDGILAANRRWSKFESQRIMPTLPPSHIIHVGPTAEQANEYAEKFLAELETKKARKDKGANQQTKTPNNYPRKGGDKATGQPAKTSSKSTDSTTSATITTTTTTTTATRAAFPSTVPNTAPTPRSLPSIQILRQKLRDLYIENPSSSLRQAMWHFDHLIVIQGGLPESALTTPEHLCLMAAATNYAQKTLEQTYRFCLKQEQAPFTTTHNLKTYHKQLDPHFSTYPTVVKDLFLANDWHRYFYTQHKKWTSHTTFQVNIPPVLEKLYKIAEGQLGSVGELNKTVEQMIEKTSKHLETLLNQTDVAANDKLSPREEVEWVKKAFQEEQFIVVQQTLENFLKNVNASHPIYSSAKQAVASLKILEGTIRQMNKSNDIREFSTWSVGSLLQVQESIENVFHTIEYYKKGKISVQHELKTLAEELGIEMGSLADHTRELSYKVRYPVENKNNSLSAQIIDDLEALKEFPDLEKGFKLQTTPKTLWAPPSSEASLSKVVKRMQGFLVETEKFLREKGVPTLQEAHQKHLFALSSKNSTH